MSDYNTNAANDCMDWNDSLNTDEKKRMLLPEGDYEFEVVGFERSRFPGSAKIPACNKANLTLQVKTDTGNVRIRCDLILHRKLEWKLSSFFCCIGQKKKGQPLAMDWSRVTGSRGRAHIIQRTYTGKDGHERKVNDVDKFYDYNPAGFQDDTQWMPVNTDDSISWD